MGSQRTLEGGCLCGNLRYSGSDPIDAGYCHCRLCQLSSGAPVLAWVGLARRNFAYDRGNPASYRSSEHGTREFCSGCGTQIAFRDARTPERIDLNIASLDDPEAVTPQYHIWTASRIAWFDTADDLPRYADDGPDAPPV